MTIAWTFVGWLLLGSSIVQMFIGINPLLSLAAGLFCLGVGDIIKAIKAARSGK